MPILTQPLASAPAAQPERSSSTEGPTLAEIAGEQVGAVASPLIGWTTRLRQARTFHPRGEVLVGHFAPLASGRADDARSSQRLAGRVLVRFSDALAKQGPQRFDVLGCALRFALEESSSSGVQDLLLATIKRPWTMPFAPFTTETRNYLANDYFGVSPFQTPEHARVWLRLRPTPDSVALPVAPPAMHTGPTDYAHADRRQLFADLVKRDGLQLELGIADGPWGPWRPWGVIHLDRLLHDDPAELAFDPCANGAGVVPRGFVHSLRRAIYARSQAARSASPGATAEG